jgi:hypothetical protein
MSQKLQEEQDSVHSTDIMARTEGSYERLNLIGHTATTLQELRDCGYENPTKESNPTNCEVVLLEFESVDGEKLVARPMTQFVSYNGQSSVIKEIYNQGYAFANIGCDNCVITPTREDARYISENISSITSTSHSIRSFLQKLQVRYGSSDYVSCDRDYSRAINCSKFASSGIRRDDIEDYLDFIQDISYQPTSGIVLEVRNVNEIVVLIRGSSYRLEFESRASSRTHIPTDLAESIGARIPENLEGKEVKVASGRYFYRESTMNVVGRNKSKTVTIGL